MELLKEYIKEILNERSSQTIMYHGTSSTFLKSILKKGMLANPPRRVWDEDPDVSSTTSSRASVGGSYWTSNLMTAISSSGKAVRKLGGERIIVISLISLNSTIADEDSVRYQAENAIMTFVREKGFYNSQDNYGELKGYLDGIPESDRNHFVEEFSPIFHQRLSGTYNKIPIDPKLARIYFWAWLNRIISYSYANEFKWKYIRGWEWATKENYNVESYNERKIIMPSSKAEADYLKALDLITKRYKESSRDKEEVNHTARTEQDIGFSGRNRIICIIELQVFTEDKPSKVLYGTLPDKFKQDYEKAVGELKL